MKKSLMLLLAAILLAGCGTTMPMTRSELFPYQGKTNDPGVGIIVFTGYQACNVQILDEADRLIEEWAEKGTSPSLSYNGQAPIRYKVVRLDPGRRYTFIVKPFYYRSVFPLRRARIDSEQQTYSISVAKLPVYYDSKYTRRYLGWAPLEINTGSIPATDYQSPSFNVQATGPLKTILQIFQ